MFCVMNRFAVCGWEAALYLDRRQRGRLVLATTIAAHALGENRTLPRARCPPSGASPLARGRHSVTCEFTGRRVRLIHGSYWNRSDMLKQLSRLTREAARALESMPLTPRVKAGASPTGTGRKRPPP